MIVETICDHCGMEYDWPGVTIGDLVYCCLACSRGEPCTCPQHNHGYVATTVPTAATETIIIQE